LQVVVHETTSLNDLTALILNLTPSYVNMQQVRQCCR